jgi:hypothetical protein
MPTFHTARRTQPGLARADVPPEQLHTEFRLDAETMTLTCAARENVWHYFRFADGTLKPLPPRPESLAFEPGDTYIALSPGARRVTDSPTIARFLHLHDVFNAEKLAAALLAHLVENAGDTPFPEDVTAMVVEAR